MLDPGDEAPPFELPNQDGDPVALSDFAGQRLVVYFYPRADTPGCTIEARDFADHWDAFRDLDVAVVGISDDPVESQASFAEKYDLPFDLLSDEDGEVGRAYGSFGERTVGDREVTAAFRNTFVVGPDGTVEAVYRGVDPDGHAEELLSEL